jgi:hypothetical protein
MVLVTVSELEELVFLIVLPESTLIPTVCVMICITHIHYSVLRLINIDAKP